MKMNDKNNNSEQRNKRNRISESKVHQMRAKSDENKTPSKIQKIRNSQQQNNSKITSSKVNPNRKTSATNPISSKNNPPISRKIRSTANTSSEVFDFEQEIIKPISAPKSSQKPVRKKTVSNPRNTNGVNNSSNPSSVNRKTVGGKTTPKQPKNIKSSVREAAENITYLNEQFPVKNKNSATKNTKQKNAASKNKTKVKGSKNFDTIQNKLNSKPKTFVEKYYKAIALLLVFVLFVGVGVWGYKKLFSSTQTKTENTATKTEQTVKTNNKVPDCDMGDLNLNVFLTENKVLVGQGANFGISVTNRSNKTCLAKAGSNKFGVRIMSGDQKIWDSVTCPVTSENNPLLLRAGQTWTGNIPWSGLTYGPNCEQLGLSGAGTYRLIGIKNGDLLDVSHPFVVGN